MTWRKRQWFTDLGSVDPTQPNSTYRHARYNGIYDGEKDTMGQGEVGKVYPVTLLGVKASTGLDAPYPPFQDPETGRRTTKKPDSAKPKKPAPVKPARKRPGSK